MPALADNGNDITYFDEQGRLSFTMRDNRAIHTAYKTIAWTIKKYDLPIDSPDNMSITVELEDESHVGEDGYVYTTIFVKRDAILDKIGECSQDWLEEIQRIGGTAYLDNIMTVSENGVNQGRLLPDGSFDGEVYNTFEGIAGARNWKNPEDLKQYFGKKVAIPADEPVHEQIPPVTENTILISDFNYSDAGISIGRIGTLTSSEYDVQRAVPSSEYADAEGSFSKYAYRMRYMKESGKRTYWVKVTAEYTLKWHDTYGNQYSRDVSYSDWYDVEREYSRYAVISLDIYELKEWRFNNDAIGRHEVKNGDTPGLTRPVTGYVEDPDYTGEAVYDGGIIYGGTVMPSVPELDLRWLAEENVGEISAASDRICIDGFEILGENGASKPADRLIRLEKKQIEIKSSSANGVYATESSVVYKKAASDLIPDSVEGKDFREDISVRVLVNPINVHTPVICHGAVNDNRGDNQCVSPDETRSSMVLGKRFIVDVSSFGSHINEKGYQSRDYGRYVLDNEVCFPFAVIRGGYSAGDEIAPGTWISLGKICENNVFYLPVTVNEGNYTIKMRTRAINEQEALSETESGHENPEGSNICIEANLDPEYYAAYSFCDVYVSGQILGFHITGSNSPEHACMKEAYADCLPVDNPVLKLGYEFTFELTTIGNMGEADEVCIKPAYSHEDKIADVYGIDSNGAGAISVTWLGGLIHGKAADDEYAAEIVCIGSEYEGHVKHWQGRFFLPRYTAVVDYGFNLEELLEQHTADRFDSVWRNYIAKPLSRAESGVITVNFDIYTVVGGSVHLSYENAQNSSRGYCNMWKQEGFNAVASADCNKASTGCRRFGDVAVYSGGDSYMEDYSVYGTH